jgi:hypothetical protein
MHNRLGIVLLFLVSGLAAPGDAFPPAPKEQAAAAAGAGDLAGFLRAKGYREIPLNLVASGHLDLEVKVKGEKLLFILDTGSGATVIDTAVARRLGLAVQKTDQTVAGIGGTHPLEKTVLDPLVIGSVHGRDEAVVSSLADVNAERKKVAARPCDGLLGAGILQLFGAVIDYPSSRLFLLDPAVAARATFEVPSGGSFDATINRMVQAGRLSLEIVVNLRKLDPVILTKAACDRLQTGMTYSEVSEILGGDLGKANLVKAYTGTLAVVQGKRRLDLTFEKGKVTAKGTQGLE